MCGSQRGRTAQSLKIQAHAHAHAHASRGSWSTKPRSFRESRLKKKYESRKEYRSCADLSSMGQ